MGCGLGPWALDGQRPRQAAGSRALLTRSGPRALHGTTEAAEQPPDHPALSGGASALSVGFRPPSSPLVPWLSPPLLLSFVGCPLCPLTPLSLHTVIYSDLTDLPSSHASSRPYTRVTCPLARSWDTAMQPYAHLCSVVSAAQRITRPDNVCTMAPRQNRCT